MAILPTRTFWLALAPVVLCALDAALTLCGQPRQYWLGDYQFVHEGSPVFRWLLLQSPWAYAAGILAWMGVFTWLIALLPRTAAAVISVTVTIGHMTGAASWLVFRLCEPSVGYALCNILFFVTSILVVVMVRLSQPRPGEVVTARSRTVLEFCVRWIVIACLAAITVWVFAIPK